MSSFLILSGILAFLAGWISKDGKLLAVGGLLFFLGVDFWTVLKLWLVLGLLTLPITLLYRD